MYNHEERMQQIRDTWAENETQRRIRKNGAYLSDDDNGRKEMCVLPIIFGDVIRDTKYKVGLTND